MLALAVFKPPASSIADIRSVHEQSPARQRLPHSASELSKIQVNQTAIDRRF
jgi:hypothetical protein